VRLEIAANADDFAGQGRREELDRVAWKPLARAFAASPYFAADFGDRIAFDDS